MEDILPKMGRNGRAIRAPPGVVGRRCEVSDSTWMWLGDVHQIAAAHWAGVISTVAAILCGALIGAERQRAQKPAGMRTLILICLGSAIFTQASLLIAGGVVAADRGRIAAQVVSGIGFLGAGAIIRERGLLIGVTTGAGIWATAAVGVVLGSGHIAAGIFFTILIVVTLAGARAFDRVVMGPCRIKTLRLVYDPADGRTRWKIQSILDGHQHDYEVTFAQPEEDRHEARIEYCASHRDHRTFLGALVTLPGILSVAEG